MRKLPLSSIFSQPVDFLNNFMPEYPFDFFVRGYHDFEDGMGDDFEDAAGPALGYILQKDTDLSNFKKRSLGVRW